MYRTRLFASATALIAVAASLAMAQEAASNSKADALKKPEVLRGQALFQQNCAACHGPNGTGGMGPNLIASSLVRHDVKGSAIGPVVHQGRMDKGMPAFPQITDAQVQDIAEFIHARIDASMRASALGASAFGGQLAVGDAAAGKAYFQAHCAGCHDSSGSFSTIAKKYDPSELEARMLAPKEPPPSGTVTAEGRTVHGVFLHRDEFSVTVRDAAGTAHTWLMRNGVHVTVDDPLRAHHELLNTYTNKDIHDVFAYLETLK